MYDHQGSTTKDSARNSAHRKCAMKRQAVPNHRIKGKKVESNIDSAIYNQTLKQQRKLNDNDYHTPINTNTKH
jgi:hypothetical protein